MPFTIISNQKTTGAYYGFYLQDEWKVFQPLTINFGARFDVVDEFAHANQFSPRVNVVLEATKSTTFHAGYARYFTPPALDHLAVARSLEAMELKDLEERQISALSGGQQQRVFLARALAQEAHVFLLDEPFSGLDKPAQDLLGSTIRRLANAGNLLVVSHHDLRTVRELFDHVIFINGELVAFGGTDQVFNEENIQKAFHTHIFSGAAHEHGLAL